MNPKLAHFKRVYNELGKKQIKVGFFEHSKYPDGTPIAYVAAIQELGHPAGNIPPRPFMRPAMQDNQARYADLMIRAAKAAINGTISVSDGLAQIGDVAAGDIQMAIRAVTAPSLKDSTVAARARRHSKGKATNKPLVDSGLMLQAVTFSVEDK
ncbi:bacteriophage protein [Xenorhabdus vietnamensis]|uniref:Bacteriophage protein n=2 Tax=Xenorhabdus vietnamensis TaxID=351656 RepID=A0A1Y2S9M6_9GAMM|nr:bacteriophage protein [Xenorhabdus vietnamensis]